MSATALQALLPLFVLAGAATLTLVLSAFLRRPLVTTWIAVAGLVAFLLSVFAAWPTERIIIDGLISIDSMGLVYWALLGLATLVVMVFNQAYFAGTDERYGETHGLMMLGLLGGAVMVVSQHFASLFLGLELLSICLFILVAWQCLLPVSVEGGVKYLVLAGAASAVLLFGMALIFAAAGTLSLPALAQLPTMPVATEWWVTGIALLLVGVLFKLSLVPFHFWTADVYQGAPLPVTAFLATVSKVAAVGLLLRLVVNMDLVAGALRWQALALVAAVSMLAGNWLALQQDNLKRLLAWSSVAHMGYALAALLVGGALAAEAVIFYSVFYVATTLVAFGVLVVLTPVAGAMPSTGDLRGLAATRPLLALMLTMALLSLAGVPLTAGFIGKFYVLAAGAGAELWWLMLLVVAGSAIGLFYYMRVVLALYSTEDRRFASLRVPLPALLCLILTTGAMLWLGVWPEPGMALAESVARELIPADTLVAGNR